MQMKAMEKVISAVLCVALLLSCAVPALSYSQEQELEWIDSEIEDSAFLCGTSWETQQELQAALIQEKIIELNQEAGVMPYYEFRGSHHCPSTGDAKLLVIPVMFADSTPVTGSWEQDYAHYQELFFGEQNDGPLDEQSVQAYFRLQSYGRLNITGTVLPIYFASKPKEEYKHVDANRYYLPMVSDALATYDIDYSQYDGNGDGYVDCICIIEGNGKVSFGPESGWAAGGGIKINSNSMKTEYIANMCAGKDPFVYYHELAHTMGLYDHYFNNASSCYISQRHEDLMGGGINYISIFYKYLLGWIDPLILTEESPIQDVELFAVEQMNPILRGERAIVYLPHAEELPFTEFFVAEYRNATHSRSVEDQKAGVTLWHCNAELDSRSYFANQTDFLQSVRPSGSTREYDRTNADLFVPPGAPWNEYSTSSVISPDTSPVNSNFKDGTPTNFYMEVLEQDEDRALLRVGTAGNTIQVQDPLMISASTYPTQTTQYYGTYGHNFQLSTTGGSGTGQVTYEVVFGDSVEVTPDGHVTVLKLGKSRIKATKAGDDTYPIPISASVGITVHPKRIDSYTISVSPIPTVTYNGTTHRPTPIIIDNETQTQLTSNDYEISYGENINVGEGSVTLTGKGNYQNSREIVFYISPLIEIGSADELRRIADEINSGNTEYINGYFELTADIDLGGSEFPWTAIGTSSKPFCGVFDGKGHTITGLYVNNRETGIYQGLFGALGRQSVVQNLGVEGTILSEVYTGSIAGVNAGTIKNCYTDCEVKASSSYTGGITGRNTGTIENCYNLGKVQGTSHTGGIAGAIFEKGILRNCYSWGEVIGSGDPSGIVAEIRGTSATVSNCYYLAGSADGGMAGVDQSDAAERKTQEQFGNESTFSGWDFSDVWMMSSTLRRPVLRAIPEERTEHTHQFSSNWFYNESKHWHACECGEKADEAAHTPVTDPAVEATCTTPGKTEGSHCSVCGYVITAQTEVPATGHSYAGTWSKDESTHWHECSKCGAKADIEAHASVTDPAVAATCTTPGKTEGSHCSVCGYVIKAQTEVPALKHSFSEIWSKDETMHWHECNKCGAKADEAMHSPVTDPAVEATCTTPGRSEGSHCSVCGYVIKAQSEIPALEHSYTSTWEKDSVNHWHECSKCHDKHDLAAHAEDAGTVTKQPTLEETGIKTYFCSVCGYEMRTEAIPNLEPEPTPTPTPTPGPDPTPTPTPTPDPTLTTKPTPDPDPTPTTKPSEPTPPPSGGGNTGGGSTPSGPSGSGETVTTPPPEPSLPPAEEQPNLVARVETVFSDIPAGKWYTKAVQNVYEKGLMQGVSPTAFSPFSSMSRGMMVTVLHRMDGAPETAPVSFGDVRDGAWYANSVSWAASNGVVYGYSDGRFGPTDDITREQVAVMLYRYAAYKGFDTAARADLSGYEDLDKVHGYAREAMEWAVAVGLIHGRSTVCLAPRDMASRAEVAQLLSRFMELQAQPAPKG